LKSFFLKLINGELEPCHSNTTISQTVKTAKMTSKKTRRSDTQASVPEEEKEVGLHQEVTD
jgi:hypothetical protein